LVKGIHLNRPGKKHNSNFGMLPIAVTKINKKDHVGQTLFQAQKQ